MVLNVNDVTTLNESFSNSRLNLFAKLFDFFRNTEGLSDSAENIEYIKQLADIKYQLDTALYNNSLSDREIAYRFIDKTIYQGAYNSLDFSLFYKFIKMWYASNRSLVSSLKKMTDIYYLNTEELDELIKSFGFPYPNKIISKRDKVSFLYRLIDFFKHKGTPYVFGEALQYFGLKDCTIFEWWLKKEQDSGELFFQAKPVYPEKETYIRENIKNVYWDDFYDSLTDYHWYQTKESINASYLLTDIKLPSITPYITIRTSFDIMRMIPGLSILQEWMQETYSYWFEYVLNYIKTPGWDPENVIDVIEDPSTSIVNNSTYIIGDSPIGAFSNYAGYYVKKNDFETWIYRKPSTSDLIYNTSTLTHWVYNGISWVNLEFEIDSTMLDSNKRGYLNRPITLPGFEYTYSIWEVMLAIGYLWNSSNDTTDSNYVYYNGLYVPLDKEISGIRDNIITDTSIYDKIYEEYDGYSKFESAELFTRDNRDSKYQSRKSSFQYPIDKVDTKKVLQTLYDPGRYLEALNPYFKDKLDDYKMSSNFDSLFGDLLMGFENYVVNNAKIIDLPFVFFLFNSYAYASFKQVIDFWKPYRARIYSFEQQIGIFDRLENSQLEKDSNCKQIVRFLVDQAPGRESVYDSSTMTDSLSIEVRYVTYS